MARHRFPSQLRLTDPDFWDRCTLWAQQMQVELDEIAATAKEAISTSWELLEKADRRAVANRRE